VIFTTDVDWDPSVIDHILDETDEWFDAQTELPPATEHKTFNKFGDYHNITVAEHFTDEFIDPLAVDSPDDMIGYCVLTHYKRAYDVEYAALVHGLGEQDTDAEWSPVDVIKRTFAATTQYTRYPLGSHLKKMFKPPFPACNVHWRREPVCTDTVYSDTPAIFGG